MGGGSRLRAAHALADPSRLALGDCVADRFGVAGHVGFGSHAGAAIRGSPTDIAANAHPGWLDPAAQPPVEAVRMAAARSLRADVPGAVRHCGAIGDCLADGLRLALGNGLPAGLGDRIAHHVRPAAGIAPSRWCGRCRRYAPGCRCGPARCCELFPGCRCSPG